MRQMAVITPYAQFLFKFVSEATEYSLSLTHTHTHTYTHTPGFLLMYSLTLAFHSGFFSFFLNEVRMLPSDLQEEQM